MKAEEQREHDIENRKIKYKSQKQLLQQERQVSEQKLTRAPSHGLQPPGLTAANVASTRLGGGTFFFRVFE